MFSQFCGTSLWFSGNAIMADLLQAFALSESSLSHLTIAVQLGFITGTLVYALGTIADRFSPSRVFFVSTIIASLCNLGVVWEENTIISLTLLRFGTGFFLAGIYPIGMKIAADYYDKRLGKYLGFLVGALVLGTAFPHLVRYSTSDLPWKAVLIATSSLAIFGGLLVYLTIPNGPFRKIGAPLQGGQILAIFKIPGFRKAAWGYFGHMWELYAFWAVVPLVLKTYNSLYPQSEIPVSLGSFGIIAIGSLACVVAGYLSERFGVKKVATCALALSMCCCVISPVLFEISSPRVMLLFLCFWGMVVIADSPLFSTLVAQNARPEVKGTAIVMVTCVGFAITIFSIQLLTSLAGNISLQFALPILAVGPGIALWQLIKR